MSDFRDDLEPDPAPAAQRAPRRPSKGVITAGLAAAIVLGIAGGLAMKPRLNDQALGKQTQNHRVVPIPKEPSSLGIVVDRTVTAVTQPPPLPVTPVGPQAPAPYPEPAVAAEPRQPGSAPVIVGSIPERTRAPTPVRPAFDCRLARSTADRLVCVDPRLAAADRRMERAYQHALDVGVPEPVLRRQQEAWLNARDEAAREGPEALADTYGKRIAELQGMARYYPSSLEGRRAGWRV
ncbi:MAG: lysozyme inhibitor LprI family protein, partial [Ignavibacteriales bacterium]